MAFFANRKSFLLTVGIGILILGGLWIYVQFPKGNGGADIDSSGVPTQSFVPNDTTQVDVSTTATSKKNGTQKIIRTETIVCDNEIYIFDIAREGNDYFNEIYKTNKSRDNLILRSQAQRELVYEGKAYIELVTFSILTVPKRNCDRIYLTSILPISHPVPAQGIFEWRIGASKIRELAISKEFAGNYVPYYPGQRKIASVSPDGERIIVAQQGDLTGENRWCNNKTLHFLDLRKDVSKVLVQLPKIETFDDGTSDLDPYCNGLNFGWQDESTIYYDVYDATKEGMRPFKERKTLVIP